MALLTHRRIWPVLAVSGGLGFLCGAFLHPTWQVVIEPSQILAGVVTYPADSPAGSFASRSWTILHQITALAIAAGIPERVLAIVWSGLVGLVSFQALALTTYAMGGTRVVAAFSPLLVFVSGASRFLPGYPVDLLGWPNTWGMVAHGLLLLLLALLALRRFGPAALLIGLFPAVHVAVGLWAWLIVGLLAVPLRNTWAGEARPMLRWWLAGVGVTAVSGLVHLTWFGAPSQPPSGDVTEIMRSVRLHWESHRLPIELMDLSVLASVAITAACVFWHRSVGVHLPRAAWWLTAGFVTAVALALFADAAIRVLPEDLGDWVARPMPRRLLSLPVLGGMAWIIGLSTGPGARPVLRGLSALYFSVIAVVFVRPIGSMPVPSQFIRPLTEPFIDNWVMVAALLAGTAGALLALAGRLPAAWERWFDGWPGRVIPRALHCALIGLAVLIVVEAALDGRANTSRILDRTTSPLLAAVAARPGILATAAGSPMVQAATRRAIVLDISLIDVLVYAPAAAGMAEHVVQRVYGMTLTEPRPPDVDPTGRTPGVFGQAIWTQRNEDTWRAIATEFGVTDVLTPSAWSLQLPLVMRDDHYALWTIPRSHVPSSR